MTDKYIAVSDIEKLKTLSHYHDEISYGWNDIQDLIAKAKPMVSYEDVRNLYINGDELGFVRVKTIKELIVEDPETYGGLTVEQWDQLKQHPYVNIELRSDMGASTKWLLHDMYIKNINANEIVKLLPDNENMTRTNLDLPDGIKVNVTFMGGSNLIKTIITPIPQLSKTVIKHYRITGVADSE